LTAAALQRTAWLAAVALLVGLAALALAHRSRGHEAVPPGVGPYYTSRAAPYGATPSHRRTACGEAFTTQLEGVAHPTLPCGVKLYLRFSGKQVLTEVVDRGPSVPGRDFAITKALADRIGLHGTQTIHWRFAR
jgi:rare lipoprotein A (RlpA)-like double-psi beta-barrel protein